MKSVEEWSHMSSSDRFKERATRKQKRRQRRREKEHPQQSEPAGAEVQKPMENSATPSVLEDEELFRQAVLDHAITLGMDPEVDQDFLWIAEKALTAELPPDWELGKSEDGTPYHYNLKTNESIWEHPLDEEFRQLFQQKKREKEEQMSREVDSIEQIPVVQIDDLEEEINALQLETKADDSAAKEVVERQKKIPVRKEKPQVDAVVESKPVQDAATDVASVEAKEHELKFCRGRIATLESKLSATEERLNVKVKEVCSLEGKLKAQGEELASKTKEVEILNREMSYIRETVATRENEASSLKKETFARTELIKQQNEQVKEEAATTKQRLATAETKLETFALQNQELKRELEALKEELKEAQVKVSQAESKRYEVALESAANRQESFQKIVTQMEELRSRLESERDVAREKNIELEKQLLLSSQECKKLDELKQKNSELEASLSRLESEKSKLEGEITKLNQKGAEDWQSKHAWKEDAIKSAYEDRCKQLVQEKQDLLAKESSHRQELQAKIASLESTNGRLRLQVQMLKEDQQERFGSSEKSLHQTQNSLEEAREEIKRLNAKVSTAKTTASSWEQLVRQKDLEMQKLQEILNEEQSTRRRESSGSRSEDSSSKIIELEGKLSGLEMRYCQELKDAVVETSKRVGMEWSENCKVQMASLRQCLADAEQTISQERLRHSLHERELVSQLDQQKNNFAEQLHMQKEENAKLCDMNRELLQILESFKSSLGQVQAQSTTNLLRPRNTPAVAPTPSFSSKDEAELVKLSMQLKSLRSQCQQLNSPLNVPSSSTRVHYDFSPVKAGGGQELWDEDVSDNMLSVSMLKSGKGCLTPEKPSRLDLIERNLLRSNLRMEERSRGTGGNIYHSNYWQAKYHI